MKPINTKATSLIIILTFCLQGTASALRPMAKANTQNRTVDFITAPADGSGDFIADLLVLDDVNVYLQLCDFLETHPDKFIAKLHIALSAFCVIIESIKALDGRLMALDRLTGNELAKKYFATEKGSYKIQQQFFERLLAAKSTIEKMLGCAESPEGLKKKVMLDSLQKFLEQAVMISYFSSNIYFGVIGDLSEIFQSEELSKPQIEQIVREIYLLKKTGSRFGFHCLALVGVEDNAVDDAGVLRSNISIRDKINNALRVIKRILGNSGYNLDGLVFNIDTDEDLILEFDTDISDIVNSAKFDYQYGISSVIMDLIKNAVLSITDGDNKVIDGIITIRLVREGNFIRITVSDSGPGIKPDILNKIFIPGFTTRDRVSDPLPTGLGTGLSKAAAEARFLGGRIAVESRHIKQYPDSHGTTFVVFLPVAGQYPFGLKVSPPGQRILPSIQKSA